MIRLGFISDPAQAPEGTPLVRTAPVARDARPGACVSTTPDASGRQFFELTFIVPEANGGKSEYWPAEMAKALDGLGWKVWRFDPLSPAKVINGSVESSLMLWGEGFWPALTMDCDVLLDVSRGGRSQVYQAVRIWEKEYRRVRFERELDFESTSQEQPVKRGGKLRGKLSRLLQSF
jgi:hypothetical protein